MDDAERNRSKVGAAEPLLTERDLRDIERAHPQGLSARQIVDLFQSRGMRLSEATFRKYVQLGMLPRSVRVGRKGRHQGSLGMYPTSTVRRINVIKRLLVSGYSIEAISRSFMRFQNDIETLQRGIRDLFRGFEEELGAPHFDRNQKRAIAKELGHAKKTAGDLVKRIVHLERRIARPPETPEPIGAGVVVGAGKSW
jgi:hypothetical protein